MTVLVTGANGFIAQHIVHALLQQDYQVIGTTRTEDKAKRLLEHFEGNRKLKFEIVPDFTPLNAFDSVFKKYGKEIDIVLHTAATIPSPRGDSYKKNIALPTLEGTKNIINAIRKYGNGTVKHLVVTSTAGSILDFSKMQDSSVTFTEKDWNPVTLDQADSNPYLAYMAGKKYAELEVWNFAKENICKVTTIHPPFVFGPWRFDDYAKDGLPPSNQVTESIIHSSAGEPLTFERKSHFADVRDVANVHLLAFQKESVSGHRLIPNGGKFTPQLVANILNADFPQLEGKISKGPKPGDSDDDIGAQFDTTISDKILNIEYKGLEESIYDTAAQVLRVEGRW
ncbi:hypothetical protein ZYGR_0AD07110 [Zygosaccharomyces rouxii]|uniref:ZYRO0G22506p n=2 Tax=Zygosaccharomyces rouxii TaxID=4956 RepID=C5E1N7_ZYGRC|nr:uncharacterized protein ZYRO0G22506g [Zygosaccharomyces rouxii]KAH9203013.1 hypothetical protein LQ764DRAFT_212365 [Zygosaccharomyces rouxii]GAV51528.1 hypothetical protein ZYGR_0AD07110 [Zygosaccharomyces rouxii]CAR30021.1 ZYRO0G22506p [Zygosaccharomyces rouxii]